MKYGFSLVELSIVLVILGLLTGGILAGQSLIRASEMRSVITQRDRIVAAAHTFRDKYFMLPGDLNNATKFWGVSHATPATCKTTAAVGTLTCDGDGNGQIDNSTGSREYYRFWQHMTNAGLIEGTYTGVEGAGGGMHHIPGQNALASKLGGSSGWTAIYSATIAGDGIFFAMPVNASTLRIGVSTGTSSFVLPIMKVEEAWNIDTKTDDGKPGFGKTIAVGWDTCTDAAANTDYTTANYLLSDSSIACALMFTF